MTQGNSALYSPHDTARLLAAQTYRNRYYPRSWVHVAITEGFSVDDVISLLETPCSILSRMSRDMECDYLCRVICREECEARRTYRLPPDPQKTAVAVRPAAVSVFSDADSKRNSKYVGFRDLVVSNSANKINIMRHIERIGRDIAIKEQSARIAERLERNGRQAYRKAPQDMIKRGLLTRLVADIPRQFNNIMFIPAVAVSARASLKKELKYWINNESDKREPLRYLVITGGENIRFGSDLKAAHKKTCRRISGAFKRLNEKYDAKIFVRVTEHTINKKAKTLNLHSNVIYSVPHLKNGGFSMFLRDLHDELGCFIKDAGTLQKVDEVVKYVCKPSEVEALEDDELVWLHDELKNTRLYQTYNNFQSFRSELDKTRHRVVFDSGNNKLKLMKKRVVDDSSLFTHSSDTPKTKEKTFSSDVFLSTLSEPGIHVDYGTKEVQYEQERLPEENKIVGLMLPHAAFFNVSEPCLMIRNYTENPVSQIGRDALRLIEDMEKGLRELVKDKLDYIGCDALSSANYKGLREFFMTGNKDIDQADSYILDTLHDISHEPDPPPRRYRPARPPNPIVSRVARVPA